MDKVVNGVKIGFTSEEMQEKAKAFLLENGYKLTSYGKNQAITDLEINDGYGYDEEFITALKTAIAMVKEEE